MFDINNHHEHVRAIIHAKYSRNFNLSRFDKSDAFSVTWLGPQSELAVTGSVDYLSLL